jgi:hypothetical protein
MLSNPVLDFILLIKKEFSQFFCIYVFLKSKCLCVVASILDLNFLNIYLIIDMIRETRSLKK